MAKRVVIEIKDPGWASDFDLVEMDPALVERGGPGSGHHGHQGRPGEVGGSLPANVGQVSAPEYLGSHRRLFGTRLVPLDEDYRNSNQPNFPSAEKFFEVHEAGAMAFYVESVYGKTPDYEPGDEPEQWYAIAHANVKSPEDDENVYGFNSWRVTKMDTEGTPFGHYEEDLDDPSDIDYFLEWLSGLYNVTFLGAVADEEGEVLRHYGPGSHPGTGSPQEVHAPDGAGGGVSPPQRIDSDWKMPVSAKAEDFVPQSVLYHGTSRSNFQSIDEIGLIPSRGKFVEWAYGEYIDAYEEADQEMPEYLYFSGPDLYVTDPEYARDPLHGAVNAMEAQVGFELDKHQGDLTEDDIRQHGLLIGLDKDEVEMMAYGQSDLLIIGESQTANEVIYNDETDEFELGDERIFTDPGPEPGDYVTWESASPSLYLYGDELVKFWKSRRSKAETKSLIRVFDKSEKPQRSIFRRFTEILGLRHYGPGTHPGTGTEQTVHAPEGTATRHSEIQTQADYIQVYDVMPREGEERREYWRRIIGNAQQIAFEDLEGIGEDVLDINIDNFLGHSWPDEVDEFERDDFPDLDDEQFSLLKDSYMWGVQEARREVLEFEVKHQIALGNVDPEDPVLDRFASKVSRPQGRRWEDLPPVLWHVTTAREAIEETGLKSRLELSLSAGAGLGGGESDTISFTGNKEITMDLEFAIHEGARVARGEYTFQDMVQDAIEGKNADRPFLGEMYTQAGPVEMFRNMSADEVNTHLAETGEIPEEVQRWITRRVEKPWGDKTPMDTAWEIYNYGFAQSRQDAGGPIYPLFFNTDVKALAAIEPEQIVTLEFRPKEGARGYAMSDTLGEWRTVGGDTVELEAVYDLIQPEWESEDLYGE